jgi:hypothetical protein
MMKINMNMKKLNMHKMNDIYIFFIFFNKIIVHNLDQYSYHFERHQKLM